MFEFIAYTLFVFWVAGIISILVDVDHIWTLCKRVCPVRFSDSYGRPFHTNTIFVVVAIIGSILVVTFVDGFFRGVLQRVGAGETTLLLICLIGVTYYLSRDISEQLLARMKKIRSEWRNEFT